MQTGRGSWDANYQKSRKAMKEKHALDRRDGKIGIGAVAAAVRFTAAAPTSSRAGARSEETRSDVSVCCGSRLLKQKAYARHRNDAITGRDRGLLLCIGARWLRNVVAREKEYAPLPLAGDR